MVHETHGIGIYQGTKRLTSEGASRDYLLVQYLGSDRRPAQAAEMGMNGVDTWFKTLLDDATWYPEARKLGMSINTWTVNDPAQMETLFKMGVDQLTTDNPMQAREVLEKIGMREVVAGKKVKIKK